MQLLWPMCSRFRQWKHLCDCNGLCILLLAGVKLDWPGLNTIFSRMCMLRGAIMMGTSATASGPWYLAIRPPCYVIKSARWLPQLPPMQVLRILRYNEPLATQPDQNNMVNLFHFASSMPKARRQLRCILITSSRPSLMLTAFITPPPQPPKSIILS